MAINLDNTWQCWWTVESTTFPNEFAMWHVSTEENSGAELQETRTAYIFDAMLAFWTALSGAGYIAGHELTMLHINKWDPTLLVPGWRELERREFLAGTHVTLGTPYPPQLTIAVTLKTLETVPGNRQSRYNRFYVPYPVEGGLSAGRVTVQTATAYLTATENLNAAIGVGATTGLLVVSEKLALGFGTVEARVGDVIDTQRRRRNQMVESYEAQLLS